METDEYLEVLVGDIGHLISATFHLLEFLLGLCYFFGQTLATWFIFVGATSVELVVQFWGILKLTGSELWEFGVEILKLILLIYYAIFMVFESFHVIIMDLKTFAVHTFVTLGQQINDTQAAVVDHTSRTFSTVPQIICESLIFIGEHATNIIYGFGILIFDFLTQLVLAPVNVIYSSVVMLSKLLDIPLYLLEVFEDIPRPGKAGLLVVVAFWVMYMKVNFVAIPTRLWNFFKSLCRGILNFCILIKNSKRIVQQVLNSDGRLETTSDTKAMCVICQDNSVSFLAIPCKHLCLCYICVKLLVDTDNRCPLCRGVVTKFEKVYIPL